MGVAPKQPTTRKESQHSHSNVPLDHRWCAVTSLTILPFSYQHFEAFKATATDLKGKTTFSERLTPVYTTSETL
jgi:hypothetical protein